MGEKNSSRMRVIKLQQLGLYIKEYNNFFKKEKKKLKKKKIQINLSSRKKDNQNKIVGRDITKPDFWENQTITTILKVMGILVIGIIIVIFVNIAFPVIKTIKEAFPVSDSSKLT